MKERIQSVWKWADIDPKKAIAAVLMGMICYVLAATPQIVDQAYDLYIIWELGLPMLASLAWGYRYGLISCILGGAMFAPFQAMERNGYANFVTAAYILIWVVGHGWFQEKYNKKQRFFYGNQLFHFAFMVFYLITNQYAIQYTVKWNPPFWYEHYAYGFIPSNIINVNQIVMMEVMTIFTFGIRSLLRIDTVRMCLGLEPEKEQQGASGIIITTIVAAFGITVVDVSQMPSDIVSFGLVSNAFRLTIGTWQVALLKIAVVVFVGDFLLQFFLYKEKIKQEEKKSRERYINIFENILDIYIEFDQTGKILETSPSACHLFKMTRNHMLECNIKDFFSYEYQKRQFEKNLEENVNMKDQELIMRRLDRSFIWLLVSTITKARENRFVFLARDITEYKKFGEERTELIATQRAVFEACTDMIWTINGANGCIINGNEACKQYFSRKWGTELKTKSNFLDACTNPEEQKMWERYYWETRNRKKFTAEYVDKENDKIFELSFYLLEINAYKYDISVFAKDVTEERKIAERMKQINEELEQRVLERTADMKKAYDELESFSYVVSHEVKTPIRAIEAYNDIIAEDSWEELTEDAQDAVDGIKGFCRKTLEMIDSILKYSKANVKKLEITPVDMKKLVTDVCDGFYQVNEGKEMDIEIGMLPEIKGDVTLLRQVISNIISNAIKFSSKKEKIQIWAHYMEDDKKYTFYFKDNGVGFEPKYAKKVFHMFQRMHTEEEFEGTGVGLAMIKNIIEKHGGEVFIFSEPEKGCVAGFTLPK